MITTLCFYLYPIPVFLKTLATTINALLVYYVLHVASPAINEANYFIILRVTCKYTCIKKNSFRFIALLFMAGLSEHERSCAIGMLKAGDVFLTSPDIIIAFRQLNSASEIVTRLLEQLKIDSGLVSQDSDRRSEPTHVDCVSTIFISTISVPTGYCQCQTNSRAPWVNCFCFFIKKIFYHNNLKSCPISRQFQIATLES